MASAVQLLAWALSLWCLSQLLKFPYRVCFHPLAAVPGPKYLALTRLSELFYDMFVEGGGRFSFYVQDLHERYGPIVRIGPNEVHVQDYDWLRTLFARGKVRDKDPSLAHAFGSSMGTFGAVEHLIHKRRRAAGSSFFSQRSINRLEPKSREYVQSLDDYLRKAFALQPDQPINIRPVLLAWGTDSITGSILGESRDILHNTAKREEWHRMYDGMREIWPIVRKWTWIVPSALAWPRLVLPLAKLALPKLVILLYLFIDMQDLAIIKAKEAKEALVHKEKGTVLPAVNIFQAIIRSSLSEDEKQPSRMAHEAAEIVGGGGATTAQGLCDALYFILASRTIQEKLIMALKDAIPDGAGLPASQELQRISYLNAVVKETLRISRIVALRSSAIAPTETLHYDKWILPPGTVMSMTHSTAMMREDVFPSPMSFTPERWLDVGENSARMEKNYLPFGLGNRSCVGKHFAIMQMHNVLAMLFTRYDLELFNTVRERDVDPWRTWATNEPCGASKGINVLIRKVKCPGQEL